MRIMSLNVWGGRVFEQLMSFLDEYSKSIDIFCFQEVFDTSTPLKVDDGFRVNLLSELRAALPNYEPYFSVAQRGHKSDDLIVDYDLSFGVAIFVRRPIIVMSSGSFATYDVEIMKREHHMPSTGILQYVQMMSNNAELTVGNLHGIWCSGSKDDNEIRLHQSHKILNFMSAKSGGKIICGDFNLLPSTLSMQILERDMENMIKKYNISSTRSSLHDGDIKFADYVLVSQEVVVHDFIVIDTMVSDHLPLLLHLDLARTGHGWNSAESPELSGATNQWY